MMQMTTPAKKNDLTQIEKHIISMATAQPLKMLIASLWNVPCFPIRNSPRDGQNQIPHKCEKAKR